MKNSPYLDRPFFPLAVALPRLLEKDEPNLATANRPRSCGSSGEPI